MAIKPLEISDDTSHKVTMFNSPDHSIQPLVDFIKSAEKSIDMYIPGIDVIAKTKTSLFIIFMFVNFNRDDQLDVW